MNPTPEKRVARELTGRELLAELGRLQAMRIHPCALVRTRASGWRLIIGSNEKPRQTELPGLDWAA